MRKVSTRLLGAALSALLIVGYTGAITTMVACTTSCATNKPPATFSPEGKIAWYGERVSAAIAVLSDTAKSAEAQGVMSRNDARAVVSATAQAQNAANALATAIRSGPTGADAKTRALAEIRSALQDLPSRLSPEAGKLVQPYVSTVLTLLALLG